MKILEFKNLLKKFCTNKAEQEVIENAYIRMVDQHRPKPEKDGSGFTHYNAPGCCAFCGRFTCSGGCFK